VSAESTETETRILDAAHAVFLRRGTAGARMQEVADEAGVNKALLHYYFRSKDRLAEAVFHRALLTLLPSVLDALRSDTPLGEKVQRVVGTYGDILRANPFLPGYVLGELTHHPDRIRRTFESVVGTRMERMGEEVLSRIGTQLEAEAEAGRMRAISARDFVVNLISLAIFPFAARPLLETVMGLDEAGFDAMVEARRETVPQFILTALRP
jgi:TetR/AcrR family transcriptional regulator